MSPSNKCSWGGLRICLLIRGSLVRRGLVLNSRLYSSFKMFMTRDQGAVRPTKSGFSVLRPFLRKVLQWGSNLLVTRKLRTGLVGYPLGCYHQS